MLVTLSRVMIGDLSTGGYPEQDGTRSLFRAGVPRAPLFWIALIVVVYLAISRFIPFDMNLPIVDEPIYASSALHYAETGEIVLGDLSAPTAVFDTVWGGSFVRVFGASYETLRLSTLVLFALSSPFMYLLCRGLGAPQVPSVIGVGAYLFNPLAFSLAYSFQTDGHAVALVVASLAFIAAGLKRANGHLGFLATGATFAAFAFLSRQQALVVVAAALLAWLRVETKTGRRLFGAIVILMPPAIVYLLHARWAESVGEPLMRTLSQEAMLSQRWQDVVPRASSTLVPLLTFLGLFAAPLLPMLLPDRALRRWVWARPLMVGLGVGCAIVWAGVVLGEVGMLGQEHWVTSSGLGGVDRTLLGWRPPLLGGLALAGLGFILIAAAFLFVVHARRAHAEETRNVRVFLWLIVGGFVAAALLSSLAFQGAVLDRYWLPILPAIICLAVATGRASRRRLAAAGVLILVMGTVATIGTRDAFVAYEEIFAFAEEVTDSGIAPRQLDGGATWMAHQFGLTELRSAGFTGYSGIVPWWVLFYGNGLQPEYAISHQALPGYEVLDRREYSSFLHIQPTFLYLLHRDAELGFYVRASDF